MTVEELKALADKLEIKYHHMNGEDKLTELIKEYCETNDLDFEVLIGNEVKRESKSKTKQKSIDLSKVTFSGLEEEANEKEAITRNREANKLVRITLTCNNPNKQKEQGVLLSVQNRQVKIRRFIPFGVKTHVEQILLDELENKVYQGFREKRVNGVTTSIPYQTPEYNIRLEGAITPKEFESIKEKQLAEGYTGEDE